MKVKSCPVQIKAAGQSDGTADGVFEALVATWDLDSVGDKIVKGAFADSLAEWTNSGDPIPVYWSHRMDDPDFNIGSVLEASETDEGLLVKAQLDLESPKAAQVYRLMKGRRVTQFSFAYDVEDYAWIEEKGEPPYMELRRLKLHEVGPTPIGANQATELIDIKAGRVLSKANEEKVAEIAKLANELLKAVKSDDSGDGEDTSKSATDSEDEKATPAPPAVTSTEPDGAQAEPPQAKSGPASLGLRLDLEAALAEV